MKCMMHTHVQYSWFPCTYVQCILTFLPCSHSHFLTKVSYSILVCCSHRHIVGRVGHQTRNVIRQFHPSRNSDCFIECIIHIIRRVHSSVLHLISGQTVVMGWERGTSSLVCKLYSTYIQCPWPAPNTATRYMAVYTCAMHAQTASGKYVTVWEYQLSHTYVYIHAITSQCIYVYKECV